MKYAISAIPTFILITFLIPSSLAQVDRINTTLSHTESESHLRFLAADELRGRNTGTIELNIAGRYIAEQFRKFNLLPLGDEKGDYLQYLPLVKYTKPESASLAIQGLEFRYDDNLCLIQGQNGEIKGSLVWVEPDSEIIAPEVDGKIVVVIPGDLRKALYNAAWISSLKEAGATGLIHIYGPGQRFPWNLVMNYLNREKTGFDSMNSDDHFPHLLVEDTARLLIEKLSKPNELSGTITIMGLKKESLNTFNVVGKIEGTDPKLKEEHVVLCAHYDHVGVQSGVGPDSIFNGTRDNGIGTTGLINAAQYFGKFPPKRSLVILALTAEEKGLLGSEFYTNNPKIPLESTVFALNIDNSGYTDTDVITLLDTNRTTIDGLVYQAASEFGLGVIGDRIPSQNYYERSDQVSFAVKGVPAVNFKMAMTAFDERISEYYHQPSDEVESVDMEYIHNYWKSYIRTAELIANWSQRPYWVKGDKFEDAGNKLYEGNE